MKLSKHADRTEKIVGVRAEDIHKWIDGLFDAENFHIFMHSGRFHGYDPYDHRKFRHCLEALPEAYEEFKGKYTKEQIKGVFECHLKDDYNGYLPHREDFENGTFTEKYHENDERAESETILSQEELSEYFKGKKHSQQNKLSGNLSKGFIYRIVVPTIIAIILFVTSIFIIVVPVFRSNMMNRKKEMIKELTSSAVSVIEYYIELERSGILPENTAKEKAAAQIKEMRYGDENKDYFWITDMYPKMIMHPYRTDLTGEDLSEYKDIKNKSGKKLFVEFVRLVKESNEGYLNYLWQWKDDASRTVPKLSYVRGIPQWNWIIGTGIYIDDVQEEINSLTNKLLLVFGFISLVLIFILVNVILQSRRIEHDRLRAETGLREAKDRYRVLVEASNEGVILEVAGKNIYSNLTLQRMLGYAEEELASMNIMNLLSQNKTINKTAIAHLEQLLSGKTKSSKFEAQVKTKSGKVLDVMITTSRIFFSKKNGHVISFREIVHKEASEVLKSVDGFQNQVGNLFISKKVGDVCRPFTTQDKDKIPEEQLISSNSLVFNALNILEKKEIDSLYIQNENNKIIGIIELSDIAKLYGGLPAELLLEIENSRSVGHVIFTLNRLPLLIKEMTNQGTNPEALKQTIGRMFDAAIKKFINISLKASGKAPVPFAFLSLGSNARHEMTMFSDQDNALVFTDVEKYDLMKVRRYFLNLADGVCSKLNKAGYPYCPGGIMAVNPKWCLSLSEWKDKFSDWILNATPESILEVNIFLDIHCVFGETNLVAELQQHILELTDRNPQFFIHFARNCLTYKAPLNLLGRIRTETKAGVKTMNIKENLKPLEIIARIYALKYKITEVGTLDRLRKMIDLNVTQSTTFKEMIYVFDYLWRIRFLTQIKSHRELRQVNDEIDLNTISDIERLNLRNVLSKISSFQTMLNFDFLDGSV
ncbi:MAG TPA: PAS domain S-box protein [Candidatus Cloacimonetes bacterium]|nr:PAS domain S-box protein [Candidatus Cloacimonadota bacterium]